jgi:two-component system, NarL family, nitrate/nitrite response regulator NarL
MNAIRVLVVDDHSLFRRGLVALLTQEAGVTVVGEAADAGEAQRRAQALQPDVILLDNHMPGVTGIAALAALREASPPSRILMLTISEDEQDLIAALRQGAQGYLLKTVDAEDLAAALVKTMRGESVVSPELTHKLINAVRGGSATASAPGAGAGAGAGPAGPTSDLAHGDNPLTPREQEILREVARGASNKEVARTLGIAETTVKIHVQHVLRKLDLSSRVQMAVWASERGLG